LLSWSHDRVLAVDHRERRRALLGEMHDCVRLGGRDQLCQSVGVGEVHVAPLDAVLALFAPALDPPLHGRDRDQRRGAALEIPPATDEVVDGDDPVALIGQMHRLRPAEIAVPAEHDHRFVTHARSS